MGDPQLGIRSPYYVVEKFTFGNYAKVHQQKVGINNEFKEMMHSNRNLIEGNFKLLERKNYDFVMFGGGFYIWNAELGVAIKVYEEESNKLLVAGIIQLNPRNRENCDALGWLESFYFDEDFSVGVPDTSFLGFSLNSLYEELMESESYRVESVGLKEILTEKSNGILDITKYNFQELKFGKLSTKLRFWNENFGMQINRDYSESLLVCSVFKYQQYFEEYRIVQCLPLERLVSAMGKKFSYSRDLSNKGQNYFVQELIRILSCELSDFLDILNSELLDWNLVGINLPGNYPLVSDELLVVY